MISKARLWSLSVTRSFSTKLPSIIYVIYMCVCVWAVRPFQSFSQNWFVEHSSFSIWAIARANWCACVFMLFPMPIFSSLHLHAEHIDSLWTPRPNADSTWLFFYTFFKGNNLVENEIERDRTNTLDTPSISLSISKHLSSRESRQYWCTCCPPLQQS